jgi:hypothetical protein
MCGEKMNAAKLAELRKVFLANNDRCEKALGQAKATSPSSNHPVGARYGASWRADCGSG